MASTLPKMMHWSHVDYRGYAVSLLLEVWLMGSVACRYVVVTRPVRQGRLKLALEEVLSMTVDTPTSRSALSPSLHAVMLIYAMGKAQRVGDGSRYLWHTIYAHSVFVPSLSG